MKTFLNLFFAFLFVSSSFAQITVKTSNSGLNLRSEPTTSSNVLFSLPNETELLYANDWAEGWIKVRHSTTAFDLSETTEEVDVTGWVNAAFVETKMFKSTILDPMSWQEQTDGCYFAIYGVDGLLGIDSYDQQETESKFKVKIKGVAYILKVIDTTNPNYTKWEHPQLKIEFFGATTDHGLESSESKGVLRVEHNGKVEYIYAALGGGC
jgi:hypothetical protein